VGGSGAKQNDPTPIPYTLFSSDFDHFETYFQICFDFLMFLFFVDFLLIFPFFGTWEGLPSQLPSQAGVT